MELVTTLLVAFPLGFFIRQRLVACLAYVAVHSYAFTLQSTQLTREWVGGSTEAFSKSPDAVPWTYGAVNLAIYALGFCLVTAGGIVATRRRMRLRRAIELAG